MKRAFWVILVLMFSIVMLGGCGSSPQQKQAKQAEKADLEWQAHEFVKESKALVKPGMGVREVIKVWGAPHRKSTGANQRMTWTYKVENIMYYRGWKEKQYTKDQGSWIVEFQDEKVTEVRDR